MPKSLTRAQLQSHKEKAVRFTRDVLNDPEREGLSFGMPNAGLIRSSRRCATLSRQERIIRFSYYGTRTRLGGRGSVSVSRFGERESGNGGERSNQGAVRINGEGMGN